ncbi:hypothetical protein EFN04_04305 [Propionibacterium freudenreichii]|nr:hypothetical protein [Propionibacterium freudenreichii]
MNPLMVHAHAPLTPQGRYRLVSRVLAGCPIAHVAAEEHVSRSTVTKWVPGTATTARRDCRTAPVPRAGVTPPARFRSST